MYAGAIDQTPKNQRPSLFPLPEISRHIPCHLFDPSRWLSEDGGTSSLVSASGPYTYLSPAIPVLVRA